MNSGIAPASDADALADGRELARVGDYAAGESEPIVANPAGPLGLAICYGLCFPDLSRTLNDAGAEVLAVPATFTRPTGVARLHVLLLARAIEAGAWAVAAAQTGNTDDRETFGHSLVVDPWGKAVLDMGQREELGFAIPR